MKAVSSDFQVYSTKGAFGVVRSLRATFPLELLAAGTRFDVTYAGITRADRMKQRYEIEEKHIQNWK